MEMIMNSSVQKNSEAGKCPFHSTFDPLEPAQIADPFPILAKMREESPVFYMEKYDLWVVTRREDVLAVYKDMVSFSNGNAHKPLSPKSQAVIDRVGADWPLPVDGSLNAMDPPEHLPVKRLVMSVFHKALPGMDEWLDQKLNGLIDRFVHQGEVDLVPAFFWPTTVGTVAHLIGAADSETERFNEWAENWFELTGSTLLTPERAEACWMAFIDFEQWAYALLEARRRAPQHDLISKLIEAQQSGAAITDRQIVTNMVGMVAAGTDTTANTIAQMIYTLLKHPDQLQRVRENPELRPQMIEEVIRLRLPIRGVVRTMTQDVQMSGVTLPKGAKVYVHLGSANHDPEMFENPDTFDIDRANAHKHVSFGAFNRACVGAPLARLEIAKALDIILERLPGLSLADENEQLRYTESMIVPSLKSLRVRWDVPVTNR
ncbi:cytochrome P450 [Paraburkholderia sp. 5N]|uniref:Cytochrome P450 n=2 Tax=Paraburkholderia elongata TaxID=2675747 RepID=A0A972P178_9BURK|nr:cytochrome P450 [Paraburkholderia elongata]